MRAPIPYPCLLALVACVLVLAACGHRSESPLSVAYVTAPQVALRDRLATVYNKIGVLENGERVEILEKQRRMVRVRTERGQEGWLELRHLAAEEVFLAFQKLAAQHAAVPVAARGAARAALNIHVTPGRDADRLFQIKEGDKLEILKRATAERPLPQAAAPAAGASQSPPVLEDWWLVRDSRSHVGWVLGRMIDVDVPVEVAQYAEGQRIVASFVLSEVEDGGRRVPQYLLMLTEPRDGLPFDFNQFRVFTWNAGRDRYETAYRERRLLGRLPVRVGRENFGREGELPAFTITVQLPDESWEERKYKMSGVIVRRILPPGAPTPARSSRR
ncbi:MAG: SH3 domain-containing protein [Terriglobales bacterium]